MQATATTNIPISENTKLEEILRVYNAQQKNLQTVKNTSISERLKKIKLLEKTVLQYRKKIQEAMHNDFRKPAIQTDFSEIYPVVAESRLYQNCLHDWAADVEVDTPLAFFGSSAKIVWEPKGRVLLLTPWNYPFQIPLKNLISAIGAGNVAIIKPSEYTPHTSEIVKEIVSKVFAENEVAVITGDHTVANELMNLRFDHIHFTGSPAVGKLIMAKAAETLTAVTLELGGKSPTIIDETANIKKTTRNLVWSKYMNIGQTCIASDYVFVHESKKDEFIKTMIEQTRKAFTENAAQSSAYCRVVNGKHFARIKRLIDDAISKGAKLEDGGQTDATQNYIAPTILSNVTPDMQLMQEEIFGPVMPVLTYKNIDEVIRFINAGEKPLALYIYSTKGKNQRYIIENTSSGAVGINESLIQNGHASLPFGGVNNSGIGKSHGHWGFKEFSNEKPVLSAWNAPSNLLTPPYSKFNETVVDVMLKYL
ncbi:MAG: aldehyde dehydrogenase family protein [Chitinophagales bacterium]|nr:aldehyde dehydrogenase family protein [Chitinophagales bacterium]